jgi:phage-related protein
MAEGFRIASAYVEIEAELDRDRLARSIQDTVSRSSTRIRETSGRRLGSSLMDGVGDAFAASFKSAVSFGISGLGGLGSALASNPITATIGAALGVAIGTAAVGAIAAAITSGAALLTGVGILGIGALLLKENKKLKKSFEDTFGSIKKTLEKAAAPLIGPFIQGLKAVEKLFKDLAPDFNAIFKAAAPLVPILTGVFRDILAPAIKGLKDAMPGITAAFQGLAAAAPGLGEAIGNLFRTIFSNPELIKRLTTQLIDFVTFIVNLAGPAIHGFTVLWGAFTNLIEMSVKGWGFGLQAISTAFDNFTNGGLKRITDAWKPLWTAIKAVWKALEDFAAADTDEELARTFDVLVGKIKIAWGELKRFIGVVWDEIWAAVKKYWNEKVIPWWENTAKPWLKQKLGALAEEAFEFLKNKAIEKLKKLPGAVVSELGIMVDKAKTAVTTGFAGAGSWLIMAGKNIIQGLIDGINAKLGSLKNLLSTVTGLIPDWKGPMEVDKKLLFPTGQAIMGGLEEGMMSGASTLERALGALTAAIPQMAAPVPAAAGGPRITVSMDGASFYGVGSADKFVSDLYDALDRYERRHR